MIPSPFDAMHADPRHYSAEELLRDGRSIRIRAIRADDRQRLRTFFESLSPQAIYFRFFSRKKNVSDDELTRLTDLDFDARVALVATYGRGEGEAFVGVGRYAVLATDPGTPRSAEIAFAVLDQEQRRGIGTLLLEHLLCVARQRGIREFEADVMMDNQEMLRVFRSSGLAAERRLSSGVVHLSMSTEATDAFSEASFTRWRLAAAESLRAFLNPRSVALVGASRRPETIGGTLLANLNRVGFRGTLHLVNPNADEIEGFASHPSVSAIGAAVDLALIAVPAASVEAAVEDCARAGVHGVVVISAGFAEKGSSGRERQERLLEIVRSSGMRLVGPNCMGVLNTDSSVLLDATFAPTWPRAGNVAILSQSGALGVAILESFESLAIGVSSFVSVGNKADVSGNDLLAYWADDAATEVIVLYLESFGNPRRFAQIAPRVTRKKPIVAVKSGRSAAGTRAASSHSAAVASLDVAVDALFEQAGVIRSTTLEELFDVTALLSTQPVPRGPRVGIVTNAGGPGILLTDACAARGLEVPELAPETAAKLAPRLSGEAALSNPIDLSASAKAADFEAAVEALGADPNVDSLVVVYIPPIAHGAEAVAAAIARAAGTVPAEKPVLTVFLSTKGAPARLACGPRGPLPSYSYPENAAQALGAAAAYGRWRSRPRGEPLTFDTQAEERIRATIDRVLAGASDARWLSHDDLAELLTAAGIPFEPGNQEGIEALVGVTDDPIFGPLVVCGLGGALADLLREAAFRLPPVTDLDAEEMLASLRSARLLDGYLGAPPGDREALRSVALRVSALIEVVPEILELELNPLRVLAPGKGAVAAGARMRIGRVGSC